MGGAACRCWCGCDLSVHQCLTIGAGCVGCGCSFICGLWLVGLPLGAGDPLRVAGAWWVLLLVVVLACGAPACWLVGCFGAAAPALVANCWRAVACGCCGGCSVKSAHCGCCLCCCCGWLLWLLVAGAFGCWCCCGAGCCFSFSVLRNKNRKKEIIFNFLVYRIKKRIKTAENNRYKNNNP